MAFLGVCEGLEHSEMRWLGAELFGFKGVRSSLKSWLVCDGAGMTPDGITAPIFLRGAAAGAAAGAFTEIVLYPIDTLKTRLQANGVSNLLRSKNVIRSLYAGILPSIAGSVPASATFYMAYDQVVRNWKGESKEVSHLLGATIGGIGILPSPSVVGSVSECNLPVLVSSVLRVPSDVIKTQIQSGNMFGVRNSIST
eukprot:765191-Hanusia_phi.AAC.3